MGELRVTPVGYFTGAIENRSRGQSPNERLSFICSAYFRFRIKLITMIVVTKQIGNPWRCLESVSWGVPRGLFYGRDRPHPSNFLWAFLGPFPDLHCFFSNSTRLLSTVTVSLK
jgi:hypothetical protein